MARTHTGHVHRSAAVRRLVVAGVFLTALTVGASIARAQTTLTWSPDGATPGSGGTGFWDITPALWFDGTSFVPWTNSTFNNAIFGGTAGTVTVTRTLNVHNITFNTAGYTITDGRLNMGGSVPTILGSGTISSSISGTAGLRFTGGTLTLLGASTYSGGTIVENGTLVVDGQHQRNRLPANSLVTVNSGGTFRILGVNAVPYSLDVAVNAGGTLNVVSGFSPLVSTELSHTHMRNLTLNSGSVVLDYSGAGSAYWAESILLHGNVTATGTSSITFGALANNARAGIALDGARTFTVTNAFDTLTVAAELENGDSGTPVGTLIKAGDGLLTLAGSNTYTGGTQVNGGTLALGSLGALASSGTISFGGGTLQYSAANTTDYSGRFSAVAGQQYRIDTNGQNVTFASALTSSGGTLDKLGAGTLTMTGANSYSGATNVIAGRLVINGDNSAATGTVSVASGATLNGTGTIGGNVVVGDGATFAPGNPLAPGTLTINGDLDLGSGAIVSYQLGQPVAGGALNDLTVVNGNLTLDGTLNVTTTAGGSFGAGIYRLFNYGGVLTNNGLTVGSVPTADYFLQTAVPNQINLINTSGLALNFWDGGDPTKRNNGAIDGGNGAWQSSAGLGNWTTLTGTPNAAWNDGAFAIFEGTAGTVTVDNSLGQVVAEGLDFASSGYVINGEALTLTETNAGTGRTTIRVGDGSAAGASETATIASVLQGNVQLVKTDLGTLILGGANTYTGGTALDGGTLQVSSDANLGAAAGALTFDGGTLATTASFSSARATTLNAEGGTFNVANATTLTMSGAIGGAGALNKINTGALVLTGTNTYSGGTTISAGTLQIGGGGTSGTIAGNVTNNGTLAFNRSDTATYGGVISGTGAVSQAGAGTTVLTGTNTYTGATTIAAGTLQLGDGTTNGSVVSNVTNNGVLAFNPATGTTTTFGGVISGTGAVNHTGTGATVMTGTNSYSGGTNVNAGTLYINGDQSAATGTLSVASGARLGGLGTIGGSVNVASGGTLAPGNGLPGTLTINGSLTLSSGSTLNYEMSQPGVISGAHNDLTVVNGNLTLDGTLNVTTPAGGSFEPGVYRLFNYGGTLTNNGLVVGAVPTPDFFLQTALPNQINLINTGGLAVIIWDGEDLTQRNNGVINGGNGVWQSSASVLGNWTTLNGSLNSPWEDGDFAIFEGTAGTVTVDNSVGQVVAEGLDFATSGYTITGGPITLIETTAGTGHTTIRVGDDTAAGVNETATIASVLQGNVQLVKTDLGTLILNGANTYTGGTAFDGGTLQVSSDANLGATAGTLTFDGGALATTASFSSARATTLNAEGGTFDVANATTLTMSGAIGGAGALTKINTGALVLTGTNTYSGGTTITAGTLQVGGGGTSGSLAGNVTNNGTLAFNRSDTVTYGGVISGTGAVTQAGAGATILTGANTYSGGTSINAGTLQLGDGTTNGSISGNVTNNAVLAFNPANGTTMNVAGVISGTGAVNQIGTGATVLTGTNTYSGGTSIHGGTLQISSDANLGAVAGALSFNGGTLAPIESFSTARATTLNAGGGTFDVDNGITMTMSGAIGGAGALTKINNGTLVLTGTSTYSGVTNIDGGTLQLGDGTATGSISGNVRNNAWLVFNPASGTSTSMGGAISGIGAVEQAGNGTTILTGANSYSGGTSISAGTLQIGNGGTSGSIAGEIENDGTLEFRRADSLTYSGGINGTGALIQSGAGTLILTGDNTYSGGTTIAAGTLQLGNGTTNGSIVGNVTNHGTLAFNRSDTVTFDDVISGTGAVNQIGTGATVLTGTNTYSGGTAINGGTLHVANDGNLGAAAGALSFNGGTLATTSSFSMARSTTLNASGGTFDVADASTLTLSGAIGGPGALSMINTGTLVLSGINTYTGATNVTSGTLLVQGNQSAATGSVSVASGATLGGSGTIGGGVTIADGGTLAPGSSAGTLTVGALTLAAGSILNYELATPNIVGGGVNDLIVVNGGLTLAGGLNVSALGGFGAGSYRLMNYGGALINNGLAFGALPSAFAYHLDTSTGGQVNLTVANPVSSSIQYWDGSQTVGDGVVNGGSGVWSTATNWTDTNGNMNQAWGGQTAVFGGTPGTVTVVGSIAFTGLQFLTDGYSLVAGAGAELTTSTPDTVVLLNPGVEATVEVPITGTGGINIQGGGTFVTTANNGYTGGTTIGPASTLQLGNGGTSGSIVGDVTNDGTLAFNRADTVSFGGTISGTGTVQQDGPGTLVLTGTNSYSGGTMFNAGIVSVSEDANLGAPSGSLTFNGGTLHTTADLSSARSTTIAGASGTIDTDEQTTFSLSGAISGSGALVKVGEGRLLLSGSNTYSGGTLVSAGTLQGNTRSLQGTIVDNASLVFDQDNDGTFRGTLFGTGTLTKRGAGLVRLTGDHGLQGMTSVLAGTLDLDGSLAGSVTVASGATFSATGLIGGGLISSGTVVVGASGAVTSATTGLDRLDGEVAATSPDHLDEQVAATSPAAGPGRLGVVGDITLSPGSQLHLGIDAAAGSASLVTDGRASIDGTSIVVDARKDGFSRVTHYAIVGARNGLTGLATVTSTSTSLEPYLSRDAGTLFVTLLRTDIPLQPFAVTGNGWGVGGAFDRTRASATGDLLYVTRQLTALDDAQLGSALDAVSGEIHASQTQLAAIDGESVMDVTRSEISSRIAWRDRVAEGAPGSRASLWGADRLRPWFRVRSDFGSFDAGSSMAGQGDRPAAHGADTMLNGVTGGLDWSFANEWLAGVGGSYADGKMTLDDLNEQSEFAAPRVLGYLGYAHDRWAVHTGVSVAHTMYDVTRRFGFAAIAPSGQPLFGTVEREARSTPAGTASDVWVEGRYNTPIGSWDLQPRIGLRAAWYRLGDWSETGADSLSLGAAAHTNSSLQGDIGLRTARAIGNVRPFLEGMYRRELSSRDLNTTIALTDQPGGLFEVEGLGLTADKFVGQAGALFLTDHVGLSLLYELHYAGAQTRHGLQFGVGF